MTTDTMIKGESTKFSACSQPLSIMLMYLNPNPNPNNSGAAPCTNSDTSTETVRFTPALPDVLFPSLSPMWTEFGTAVGSAARDNKHRHTPGDPNLRVRAV